MTERVVSVLPQMKCPFILEPHQIQGLDYINIFPVIQWLVKESVKLRSEKAERLKLFAVGQFHNHFSLTTTEQEQIERDNVLMAIKKIEDLYAAKRQYKRKQNIEPDDELSRVRLTLLEYGIKSLTKSTGKYSEAGKSQDSNKENFSDKVEQEEVCQTILNLFRLLNVRVYFV